MKFDKSMLKINVRDYVNRRNLLFCAFALVAFVMTYTPIQALRSSGKSEYYTHIALIPLITLYLLFLKRKEIFGAQRYDLTRGIPVLVAALALFAFGQIWGVSLDRNNFASLIALSVVIFIQGAFVLLYGTKAYRIALFPLCFLIFIVPVPTTMMDGIIFLLQAGSTEFTNLLFWISGVPFMRDGFVFHLPQVSVEVAKQCSGIRSGLALFITAILAGYLFLRSPWKIVILAVCAIVIAMFKNGIRILTLSLLGNYVDVRILESSLHREGGIPFFILALLLMAPILFFLRRRENPVRKAPDEPSEGNG
ncbi:MAG: exosortase/archaeosortase family protein [Smithellaceae bacterium]